MVVILVFFPTLVYQKVDDVISAQNFALGEDSVEEIQIQVSPREVAELLLLVPQEIAGEHHPPADKNVGSVQILDLPVSGGSQDQNLPPPIVLHYPSRNDLRQVGREEEVNCLDQELNNRPEPVGRNCSEGENPQTPNNSPLRYHCPLLPLPPGPSPSSSASGQRREMGSNQSRPQFGAVFPEAQEIQRPQPESVGGFREHPHLENMCQPLLGAREEEIIQNNMRERRMS